MKIVAADNEQNALDILLRAIGEALPDAEVKGYRRASAMLADVQDSRQPPDVAFLDIEMPGMSGLELAKRLKDLHGATNIVFVTGFSNYAFDAFQVHACGYLLKPATKEKVLDAMEHLHHIPQPAAGEKRVRVQCFGSFEVFVDGKPLAFPRKRSKELLAYLVSQQGAVRTMAEIAEALWEDGVYDLSRNNQIHSFLHDLLKALDAVEVKGLILRQRNGLAVNTEMIDCDMYRCIQGDPAAINAYRGEFMSQYAWAEFFIGGLLQKV